MLQVVISPGCTGEAIMPHSEVCMHMRVAGKSMRFKLLNHRMVQLFTPDETCWYCDGKTGCDHCYDTGWRMFSSPILTGEAGLYFEHDNFFHYYPKSGSLK